MLKRIVAVQDMPSLHFALLNIASAVEECDARNFDKSWNAWLKKKECCTGNENTST